MDCGPGGIPVAANVDDAAPGGLADKARTDDADEWVDSASTDSEVEL